MINVVFTILVNIVKDLKLRFNNANYLWEKSAIWSKPLVQKEETSKQTPSMLYYKY